MTQNNDSEEIASNMSRQQPAATAYGQFEPAAAATSGGNGGRSEVQINAPIIQSSPFVTQVNSQPTLIHPFRGRQRPGELDWTPGPTIDEFLTNCEAYFHSNGIISDDRKITTFMMAVDQSRGNASEST